MIDGLAGNDIIKGFDGNGTVHGIARTEAPFSAGQGPQMHRKQLFKRHRFLSRIGLFAVRMYLRYPLSYQDVADQLG